MPGGREATKVIQANQIHVSEQRPHAVDAPPVAGLTQRVPVVNRVAPELTVGAEVIGRNSTHKPRTIALIELE